VNPVTLILGLAIVAACVYAIVRTWKRPKGRRITQRWQLTLLALGGVVVGGTLAVPSNNSTLTSIWVWTVVCLIVLIFIGWIVTECADLIGASKARARDIELGRPPVPQPAKFLFAFVALAIVLTMFFAAMVFPWVFIAVFEDAVSAWFANSNGPMPSDLIATDTRLQVAAWIALGAGVLTAAAVAGGRVLLRLRRIAAHARLTAGIQARLRGAYEDGYAAGSTGGEYQPDAIR
jgi:hypothetical protein